MLDTGIHPVLCRVLDVAIPRLALKSMNVFMCPSFACVGKLHFVYTQACDGNQMACSLA